MSKQRGLGRAPAIVLGTLLVTGVPAGPTTHDDPAALTLTVGTVQAVDPATRRVTVITGCGHALRLVAFQVGPSCRIDVAGRAAELARVECGQVVEVLHHESDGTPVAEHITTTRASTTQRERPR